MDKKEFYGFIGEVLTLTLLAAAAFCVLFAFATIIFAVTP